MSQGPERRSIGKHTRTEERIHTVQGKMVLIKVTGIPGLGPVTFHTTRPKAERQLSNQLSHEL